MKKAVYYAWKLGMACFFVLVGSYFIVSETTFFSQSVSDGLLLLVLAILWLGVVPNVEEETKNTQIP